jgi:hypothetical protein
VRKMRAVAASETLFHFFFWHVGLFYATEVLKYNIKFYNISSFSLLCSSLQEFFCFHSQVQNKNVFHIVAILIFPFLTSENLCS